MEHAAKRPTALVLRTPAPAPGRAERPPHVPPPAVEGARPEAH
jgi:hypothetical protein